MLHNSQDKFSGDPSLKPGEFSVGMPRVARGTGSSGGKSVVMQEVGPMRVQDDIEALTAGLGEVIASAGGGGSSGFASFMETRKFADAGAAPLDPSRGRAVKEYSDDLDDTEVDNGRGQRKSMEKPDTKPVVARGGIMYTAEQVERIIRNTINQIEAGRTTPEKMLFTRDEVQAMIQNEVHQAVKALSPQRQAADKPEESKKDGFGMGDNQEGGDVRKPGVPAGGNIVTKEKTREAEGQEEMDDVIDTIVMFMKQTGKSFDETVAMPMYKMMVESYDIEQIRNNVEESLKIAAVQFQSREGSHVKNGRIEDDNIEYLAGLQEGDLQELADLRAIEDGTFRPRQGDGEIVKGDVVEVLNGNYQGQQGQVEDVGKAIEEVEGHIQYDVKMPDGQVRYFGTGDLKKVGSRKIVAIFAEGDEIEVVRGFTSGDGQIYFEPGKRGTVTYSDEPGGGTNVWVKFPEREMQVHNVNLKKVGQGTGHSNPAGEGTPAKEKREKSSTPGNFNKQVKDEYACEHTSKRQARKLADRHILATHLIEAQDSKAVTKQINEKDLEHKAPRDGVKTVVRDRAQFQTVKDNPVEVTRTDRVPGDMIYGDDKRDEMTKFRKTKGNLEKKAFEVGDKVVWNDMKGVVELTDASEGTRIQIRLDDGDIVNAKPESLKLEKEMQAPMTTPPTAPPVPAAPVPAGPTPTMTVRGNKKVSDAYKQSIAQLVRIANDCDKKGMKEQAERIDKMITNLSEQLKRVGWVEKMLVTELVNRNIAMANHSDFVTLTKKAMKEPHKTPEQIINEHFANLQSIFFKNNDEGNEGWFKEVDWL